MAKAPFLLLTFFVKFLIIRTIPPPPLRMSSNNPPAKSVTIISSFIPAKVPARINIHIIRRMLDCPTPNKFSSNRQFPAKKWLSLIFGGGWILAIPNLLIVS